jgi:hypothetical protein
MMGYGQTEATSTRQTVQALRGTSDAEVLRRRHRGSGDLLSSEILRSGLHGSGADAEDAGLPDATATLTGQSRTGVREVRSDEDPSAPSHRRECGEQSAWQRDDALRWLPHEVALGEREETVATEGALLCLRKSGATARDVSEALVPLCEVWRSASDEAKVRIFHAIGPSLERRLRRVNREALKAYGNSVVPSVVALIGQAILDAEREQ